VPGFVVENFGCRATQADGAALERQFRDRGLARAASTTSAELVVLNTCTVTAAADQDARAAIRRIRRQNPGCEIVVTGCYAQRAPEEVAALPGVSRVIGNSHKHELAEIVLGRSSSFVPLSSLRTENWKSATDRQRPTTNNQRRLFVSDIFAHTELLAAPVFDGGFDGAENGRTRPNLKVQDGCDNRCSFCIIPSVRGHSRSLPMDEILHQVNALVAAGYRELVISGINLGRWGRDLPVWGGRPFGSAQGRPCPPRFEDLVRAILSNTPLEKLRLSSIEPMDWSDELIELAANSPRIAKHAHVPMQSGSDRILRLMHRKYRPWHYRENIEKIRAAMPDAAIGADVMVGFPGETGADFEATRRMIEELTFTYLHVFTYSSRPGTPSAAMRDQVPVHIARERNAVLRELGAKKKLVFMQSFVGKTLQAITLGAHLTALSSRAEPGDSRSESLGGVEGPCVPYTEALTDNYLKLRVAGHHDANRWLPARIEEVRDGELRGVAV
jgi:threonylcarbamoyladenosine tRNA methylthiotransferase MtaB